VGYIKRRLCSRRERALNRVKSKETFEQEPKKEIPID